MSAYVFVLTWLMHGTVLGAVMLVLPRLFRVSDPRRLTWWWGTGAMGVVVFPVLPLFGPADPPVAAPAVVAFVESTTVAFGQASAGGATVAPLVVIGLAWALGAAARVMWVVVGARRLARIAALAEPIEDDVALARARALVPARGRRFPLAGLPVPVVASPAGVACAFGWRPVRVLVPSALRDQPAGQRLAVYLHELLHAARGDVHRAQGDEVWRALFWWQPAVWWMLARLRLAREHEVDAEVVALTGGTRDYVEALVWCSSLRPVLSFGLHAGGHRHALVRRVAHLCGGGGHVSRTHRWMINGGMVLLASAVSTTLGLVVPLGATMTAQEATRELKGPGPLERVAKLPTLDAPAPRRVVAVEPVWAEPGGRRFRVHLVIDAVGRVAEARAVGRFEASVDAVPVDVARAEEAALVAVRQWQFEAPVAAPLLVATDVTVGDPGLPAPSAATRPPLRIGGAVMPPKKLVDVPPVYPEVAKEAGVQGVVIIEATIDADGVVQDTKVLRSIPLLDAAALTAVKQWRYTPTWLNGEAVPITMTMTVNFTLQ